VLPVETGAHRVLGQHLIDGDVLADVAKEVEQRDVRRPRRVVDQRGGIAAALEVEQTFQLWLDAFKIALERLAIEQVALLGTPSWIADHTGRATSQREWAVSGHLKSTQAELPHEVAHVEGVCGWIEADIHPDRSRDETVGKSHEVGAVVDEATGLEVGEQVHAKRNGTAAGSLRIHYVAAVSPGDSRAVTACQQLFADFAQTCDAPLYADLAAGIAEDPQLSRLLLAAPHSQRLPVLLFASVHWLLLAEPTAPLARYYPNLPVPQDLPPGGRRVSAIDAFRDFCADRTGQLAELLSTRRTQTNEIGRSALFVPSLGELAAECGPLAHVDVGASAGLNLLIPHYDFVYDPGGAVMTGSTVTITCSTRGDVPVPATHPPIAAAIGLDTDPVDVSDPLQARWLEACVWPDQVERFKRLGAAIEIANRAGVDVRPGDAIDTVAGLIGEAARSGHPVVTPTWVLNYFATEARHQFVAALDRAAESADISWLIAESPALCPELPGIPHARQGPKQPTAVVVVRWRGGRRDARHVANAHPHGRWLHWQ
jgi:hypothetical protein